MDVTIPDPGCPGGEPPRVAASVMVAHIRVDGGVGHGHLAVGVRRLRVRRRLPEGHVGAVPGRVREVAQGPQIHGQARPHHGAGGLVEVEELELDDYIANFRRMFGNPRMDAVTGSVDGTVRFFGLTPTSPQLEGLDRHKRLLDSYRKLHAARARVTRP